MARSSYIYYVTKNGVIVSAFTVKHEMINSLPDFSDDIIKNNLKIFRINDGGSYGEKQNIDITDEIIKKEYDNKI